MLEVDDSRQPSDLEWSERTTGGRTTFTVAPPRMNALPILVFAGVWDSFIIFFYMAMIRATRPPTLGFFLFPMGHVLVGIFVTWQALVKTLNHSRLTLDRTAFVVTQAPIWARGARFDASEIERFELRETESRRAVTWSIRVLTRDGKATRLALPLDQRDHVGFVAGKLNAALAELRAPIGYREPAAIP
jgi:hypothetical protein